MVCYWNFRFKVTLHLNKTLKSPNVNYEIRSQIKANSKMQMSKTYFNQTKITTKEENKSYSK